MRAWVIERTGPIDRGAVFRRVDRDVPRPAPGEALVKVRACGVCRTDLHAVEGDLDLPALPLVPGHQAAGEVVEAPAGSGLAAGDRVGIPWLRATCGRCRFCASGRENLCPDARFTGFHADGGYADYATVPAAFALPLPAGVGALDAAPLLCAGVIGFRALRLSGIRPGGRLGLYGFGAAAHLAIQVARHWRCETFVFTRGGEHAAFARSLGAVWVGRSDEAPPAPLDAAVVFAPAGVVVPHALRALDRGGTVAIAGIHMTAIPSLDYDRDLFLERTLRSVTANTREDALEFLRLAAEVPVRTAVERVPFDRAREALVRLARGEVRGAAVLDMDGA
jgi:propanol-preferring alcohol dehydrogenase